MAKKTNPGIVMAPAMTQAQLQKLLGLRSSSAALPQASKRDLLGRRNGKIARRNRAESLRRDSW
jgi:hypothetical protein